MAVTKYVTDWIERADEDIHVVDILIDEGGPANTACFHAQQAAEKLLKAFLAFRGQHVRKIHALDALLAECQKLDVTLASLRDDALFLTQFYLETRYPGDLPDFSMTDAKKARDAARHINTAIKKRLSL